MSDKEKIITLKGFEKTVSAKEGDKKYIVTFKSEKGEKITFPKNKKGEKATITVKFRESTQKIEDATDVPVEVVNDTGPIFTNIKLPKTINNIEMKDQLSLPVKGYEMGFYIGSVVLLIGLLGFVY